jgi:hypothetical protein
VRALIARAAARQASDRSAPRSFPEWRSRLCDVPADTRTPGALAREALAGAAGDLARVCGWVSDGALGPWPPAVERVQPLISRLDEIGKGVVIVSGAARRDQVDSAVGQALDEIYDDGERERIASALEETAYVWWRTNREDDARLAVSAAAEFRTRTPSENPLARALIERLLAPALARAREENPTPAPAGGPR